MKITTLIDKVCGIPSTLYYREDGEKKPCVILLHGFSNDKFEGSKIAMKLAIEGVAVLCIDIDRHGDRYDGFMENIESDAQFGMALYSVIENTASDVKSIVEEIKNNEIIDGDRIGVLGLSLGGNVVNLLLAQKVELKTAVSILGSPKFKELMFYGMEKEEERDFITEEERKLLEYVKSIDPCEKLLEWDIKTPVLMINGSNDDSVPAEYSRDFYEKVKDKTDGLKYLEEEEFHFVSNSMIDESIQWIKDTLPC